MSMPRTPLDLDTALDSLKLPSAEGSSLQDFLGVQISSAGLAQATVPLQDLADFRSRRACSIDRPAMPLQKLISLSCSQTCLLISGTAILQPYPWMTILGAKPGMDLTRGG